MDASTPAPEPFGATSTTDEVLAGHVLTGKRVLVTGVSAGLGVETARALVAHGASVVGTARDLGKAKAATAAIAADGPGGLTLLELDLASLASVRRASAELLGEGRPFDLVITNAGVMAPPLGHTEDGFETQFGTNHLGHFLLVNRIAPLIADGGRLVVVASSAHRLADVDLADPGFVTTPYEPWLGYGRSKTANVLFAVEFDRRHRHRGVRATALHPGGIRTELGRHLGGTALDDMVAALDAERAAAGQPPYAWKSIPQGAATSVWAGIVADPAETGGRYCEDCHVSPIVGADAHPTAEGVRAYALDPERARALWALSEELVGETF